MLSEMRRGWMGSNDGHTSGESNEQKSDRTASPRDVDIYSLEQAEKSNREVALTVRNVPHKACTTAWLTPSTECVKQALSNSWTMRKYHTNSFSPRVCNIAHVLLHWSGAQVNSLIESVNSD